MEKEENFLKEEYDIVEKLEDEFYKDIYTKEIENAYQRRDLLKHISIISIAILGLSPLVLNESANKDFFIIGIFMHLALVFFVVSRLREILDQDSNGLKEIENSKGEILEERKNIIIKCLEEKSSFEQYTKKIAESNGYKKIIKEVESRKNQEFDCSFKVIIFIFITASFFILIAILNFNLNIQWIIACMLIFFVLSFSNFSAKIIKVLSKLSMSVFPKLIKWFKSKNEKT
ncbi:MAG: hypothetical protein KAI67_01470 [Candidatus Pacebacteria bacterium]|nr:hypothetical protein [Candidatus Paceibacterota bacterium]